MNIVDETELFLISFGRTFIFQQNDTMIIIFLLFFFFFFGGGGGESL